MFFLLRIAFWLSVVIFLLPSATTSKKEGGRMPIGAAEALGAAQAAVDDARGFCMRRPEACETGSQALHTFGQKAQQGAKLLYEFLSDRFADTPASNPLKERDATGSVPRPGRHTLSAEDAQPGWRGPEARVPLPPRRPS
jgi:Family of unknown function (DUF5330)